MTMRKLNAPLVGAIAAGSLLAWAVGGPVLRSLVVALAVVVSCLFLVQLARRMYAGLNDGVASLAGPGSTGVRPAAWTWVAGVGALAAISVVGSHLAVANSDAYQLALAAARASSSCVDALGTPVQAGWFVESQFSFGDPATADLAIPLEGPRGRSLLRAAASRANGEWRLSKLTLEGSPAGGQVVLLRAEQGGKP